MMQDVAFSLLLLCSCFSAANGHGRLISDLLSTYDIRERPVENASDAVTIEMELGLRNIISIDATTQLVKSSVWMRQYWNDPRFRWNPDDYNGTSVVFLDHKYHWKPDIVLYNNAQEELKKVHEDVITQVSHSGNMVYLHPAIYTTTCQIDVYYFPFDQQSCNFQFGSWAYDGASLILKTHRNSSAEYANYQKNAEWILVNYSARESTVKYNCCAEPFYDVTFWMTLRRRWLITFFYVFLPLVITNSMATVQFVLPVDSSEKITLCITLFLTQIVFLLLLAEMLPVTQAVPVLIHYISGTLILVGLSMLSTVLVLHLHFNGSHDNHMQMPAWMRNYCLHWLSRLLCMHRFVTSDEEHDVKTSLYRSSAELISEEPEDEEKGEEVEMSHTEQIPYVASRFRRRSSVHPVSNKIRDSPSNLSSTNSVLRIRPSDLHQHKDIILFKLLKHAETHQEKTQEEERDKELHCEWQQLAMLVDRLFFVIFLASSIILHLYVFLNHPVYSDDVIK